MIRVRMTMAVSLAAFGMLTASAHASFGIEPGSFKTIALNGDGTIDAQAGSHPYEYTVSFGFNRNGKGEPEGDVRDVEVDLPTGMVGNPQVVSRCSQQDFEGQQAFCPGDTQVGIVHAQVEGSGTTIETAVYNLVPPPGVPATLGFSAIGLNGIQDASVRTGKGYGVAVTANNVPTSGIGFISETIWGVPADPRHDEERRCVVESGGKKTSFVGCASDLTPRPFLTLPTSCTGSLSTTLKVDSTEAPGAFPANALTANALSAPVATAGCEKLSFDPSLEIQPDTTSAEAPSGLNVELKIPQPESPNGLAEANLKEAVVSLPAGMTVSPSAANGLTACPLRGPEGINLESSEPAKCPNASKIGQVEVQTPLLEHPLTGSVFLAQQGNLAGNGENPFGSLLALYVVAEGEGIVIKLPGKLELDDATGRLTARFGAKDPITGEEFIPQQPFSDLKMSFFGGPLAPLITPSACGTYTTTALLTPYGNEDSSIGPASPPVQSSSSFTIDRDCAHSFSPSFEAGTTNKQAGAYSSFSLTLSRQDGEQRLAGLQVTEPPGLLATLKNAAQCPEPQASQGACPPDSLIGETTVAAGPGEDPYWVKGGSVYLTGPYKGAPFGLSIKVPAVAGPINLGTVVVRASIAVDPHTAQAIVTSDPFPTMLQGISLDVRTVNVTINRPGFIFNPTNCAPGAVTGTVDSTANIEAALASPFSAVNCASLPFKPSFSASTQGKTSKAAGASLTVDVSEKPGEANIHQVALQLPLILPARLTTLQKACTAAQFEVNPAGCPEGSNIGTATAVTPVLSVPVTGPAYLVSHGGAAFPDVEFILQGEGVEIVLDGKTDINKGITYSRFETVPDAPISSFETILPEGPHSALAANGNLCAPTKTVNVRKRVAVSVHGRVKRITKTIKQTVPAPLQIPTTLTGQNGATVAQNTKITVTGCPKIKKITKTPAKHKKTKKK
jgi:hypothetical protein